ILLSTESLCYLVLVYNLISLFPISLFIEGYWELCSLFLFSYESRFLHSHITGVNRDKYPTYSKLLNLILRNIKMYNVLKTAVLASIVIVGSIEVAKEIKRLK